MKFTYSSGQRILDGYTLKRGIGRGGFGEVFYALSDGGKEVALKLVRGTNLDVELRGMAQCLNLKHPNLLTLYDIRTDGQGDHWVIMEYINGEPLNAILARHPQGLPGEQVRPWFEQLAQAVAYLHSHGIVHRDLKPANIFVENNFVKVGDYGLSKFISTSRHSAQTQSIGTVHYMAPEISTGNYNKQIDVYAAGVILYEMLTGHVPFDGESAGEILMKHLTSPPDLSMVPKLYVPVVAKALAKNPAHRYPGMMEMASALKAATGGESRPSVAAPAMPTPAAVSRPAAPAQAGPQVAGAQPAATPRAVLPSTQAYVPPARVDLRKQIGELCGSMTLAVIFAGLGCLLWSTVAHVSKWELGAEFFLTVLACWAVLLPAKFWDGRQGDAIIRRLFMMGLGVGIGLAAIWMNQGRLELPESGRSWVRIGATRVNVTGLQNLAQQSVSEVLYFGLIFVAIRWWRMAERRRCQRFSLGPVLGASILALILWGMFHSHAPAAPGVLPIVLASAIVQLVSPWEPPPVPPLKRMRLRYS